MRNSLLRSTLRPRTHSSLRLTSHNRSLQAKEFYDPSRAEIGQVGEYLDAFVRDGDTVTPFGKIKVTEDRRLKLGIISNDLDGHAPYVSDDEKLADYKGYYGDEVTLDTEFTIYDFEYTPDITVFSTRPDTLFGATFLVLTRASIGTRTLANDNAHSGKCLHRPSAQKVRDASARVKARQVYLPAHMRSTRRAASVCRSG